MTATSEPRGSTPSTVDPELAETLVAFANLDYRDKFWPGRPYEDQCDRIALRALLPRDGDRLIEVGAGFGRLADEYGGYREVVLLDPSDVLIGSAQERLGADSRLTFQAGVAQHLPFPDDSFDAVVCVRVLHHFGDPRPAIAEFARVLQPGGVLVVEVANKRNLKAILAWLTRRRRTSPLRRGSQPYADISLVPQRGVSGPTRNAPTRSSEGRPPDRWSSSTSYLHAPKDVRTWLADAGLAVERTRSVALLRPPILTGHLPIRLLVGLERLLQPGLAAVMPGPSMFLSAVRRRDREDGDSHRPDGGGD